MHVIIWQHLHVLTVNNSVPEVNQSKPMFPQSHIAPHFLILFSTSCSILVALQPFYFCSELLIPVLSVELLYSGATAALLLTNCCCYHWRLIG